MYSKLRSWHLLFVTVLGLAPGASAQTVERVTLERALELFAERNLELKLARARADATVGFSRRASGYPNPVASVTHERLGNGDVSYGESYLALHQEVAWPWRQSASSRVVSHTARAMQASTSRDSLRLAFELKQAFVRAGASEDRYQLLEQVRDVFRRAERAGTQRYEQGDLSGYDIRRLRVELARYETLVEREAVELRHTRRALARIVLGETDGRELGPAEPLVRPPRSIPEDLETLALRQRPEILQAQETALADYQRNLVARASRLPNLTLTGAFKTQSDGFRGALLGVAWPIPVFNSNGAAVAATDAQFEAATRQEELARQVVIDDVRDALASFEAAQSITSMGDQLLDDYGRILTIANAAYDEGAMSLIELLDAAEAYWRAGQTATGIRSQLWIAYFDLERAVGGFDLGTERGP